MAAVGDIIQVRSYCLLGNQAGINVHHFRVEAIAGTGATESEISTGFNNLIATPLKALISSAASFRGTSHRRVFPSVDIERFNIAGQGPGGATGDPLPKQICGIITWTSLAPGRANRGRNYIPFPTEAHNDTDGTPTAAYLALLSTFAAAINIHTTAFGTGGNTTTFSHGLPHRFLHPWTELWSYVTRDRWATQRRRGDYGKTNLLPI